MTEELQAAVVVAAGRERRQAPVGVTEWRRVQDAVSGCIGRVGRVFTRDAVGFGEWDGRPEESVTAAGEVPGWGVQDVLRRARTLAEWHAQDAVAVTVGVTVLVEAEAPVPGDAELARQLRELAAAIERKGS